METLDIDSFTGVLRDLFPDGGEITYTVTTKLLTIVTPYWDIYFTPTNDGHWKFDDILFNTRVEKKGLETDVINTALKYFLVA